MSRHVQALVLVGVTLSGAACGVGTQRSAQLINRHDVPYGLLASGPTTPPTVAAPSVDVTLYFEGPQGLVPVVRKVRAPGTVTASLAELGNGPTSSDGNGMLQSPVSTVTPLTLKSIQNSTAYVSVPTAFSNLGGQEQIVAAAQVVYTVTAVAGLSAVVLLVNGQAAQVPVSGGNLHQGPLTRADYQGMLAP
ncbi:MAG TPA: hypothetical protein DCQ30_09490 [Acidimicrobiaceae bacterium]|nr:hypothetical protein [Acidimicrobiaceae bacterium]